MIVDIVSYLCIAVIFGIGLWTCYQVVQIIKERRQ